MSKTRDFDAMQKRRMRAANLLQRGFTQAQVAARAWCIAAVGITLGCRG